MVRVDFAKLDHLLNLVGELIVHRTKLSELARQVADVVPGAGPELLASVHQVAGVSTQLQETIMDVRMLPLRHVFERFPRLVRDLARQQGKQVELVLQGEDTRVDKAVIDELGEPLVHLIRNAVDHGIEPPAARAARGKPPTGTILLSAAQESNQVVITLVDDGGGIDAAEVRRRAIQRGIVRADEALSDRDAIQLIFTEGFSTARTVTDVSGRGVGLDVVVQQHGAAQRPHRGGDDPRRGDQVHPAAAAHSRHHHRAHGGGGGGGLRAPLGGGGREPPLPEERGHPDRRP